MSSETSSASQNEPSKELREQLIVSEYNQCRNALVKNIELMDRSETFFLSAAAAAFAYFFPNHENQTFAVIFKVLPLLILLAGLQRFFVLDKAVGYYNDYLVSIEDRYKNLINLTNYFRGRNNKRLFWIRLVPYCAAISIYSGYCCFFLKNNFILLFLSVSAFLLSTLLLIVCIVSLICIECGCRKPCGCGHVCSTAPRESKCVFLFGEFNPRP